MAKTLFITGGSRGIGEALVRRCAGKYNVAFTFNKSKDKAKAIECDLEKYGGVLAIECDVTDADSVKNAVNSAIKRFGKIDVLINNAGVSGSGLFIDSSLKDWQRIFDVNVIGTFNVTKAVLPSMLSRGDGAIVNVSSVWGICGASMETVYSASKSAVIGFTKALAKEVAPSNVRVNAVAPGAVDTDMMKEYTQAEIDELCQTSIPLGRLANPDEVAAAIITLAETPYATGTVLEITGGLQ